jgi:hypothetical protein
MTNCQRHKIIMLLIQQLYVFLNCDAMAESLCRMALCPFSRIGGLVSQSGLVSWMSG